jgi:hypothetical protein
MISIARKDGRSQRDSLANNLPANAADIVKAVHGCRMGMPGRNVKPGFGRFFAQAPARKSPLPDGRDH